MAIEQGQDFAARHWGGAGVVAVPSPVTYGPRACDGGRPRYPAGWAFQAEGFRYRVWRKGRVWHMEAHDGSFATFSLAEKHWVVLGHGDPRLVEAREVCDAG